MANNLKPQNPRNVFQHQSHPSSLQRPRGGVWQDKSAEKSDRAASRQPAPLLNSSRSRVLRTEMFRSNKLDYTKAKLVPMTSHVHPLIRAEAERIADHEGLSLSQIGSTAIEELVRKKLHKQQESLLFPTLTQWLRNELRKFGNRIVDLLLRTAIASEQSRILITEVLKRLLVLNHHITQLIFLLTKEKEQGSLKKREPESPIETFNTIVDKSYKMARANVFRRSYDSKKMLADWEAWGGEEEGVEKNRE